MNDQRSGGPGGRKPRLLLLGGSSRHDGGVEHFVKRAAEALSRRGGWTIERLPTNSAYLRPASFGDYWASLRALRRYRGPVDCVWLQYGNLMDLSFLAASKALGLRVLVTPHLGPGQRSLHAPVLGSLSRRLLRLADRLALLSRSQEAELELSSFPRSFIRTFLPAEIFAGERGSRPDDGVKRLVHAARLSEDKGSVLVVDVCARLRDAGVPCSAEIIGSADPETLEALRRSIAGEKLEGHVRLLGSLAMPDLVQHLRQADVLLHLSRADAYPLIVLEGLACGLLPICLDLPGARSMVESYDGYVIGHDGPAEKAAEIVAGLEPGESRERGRAASAAVLKDHDWGSAADALDRALRDCMADAATRG